MIDTSTAAFIALFITIIGLIVMNIMQKIQYDDIIMIRRKKPMKEYLFPPVLPIHLSPPIRPKFSGKHSKSLPIINV
jgi:hypothetical protein